MLVGFKCNQKLLQQLIAVQAALRSPTKSDALRRLIQDAYQNFFAAKQPIDSIAPNSSPLSDEELAALDRRECVSVKEEEDY